MFKELPPPEYEYDTARLVRYYVQALDEIQRELLTLDLMDTRRAHVLATLQSITEILRQLDVDASALVSEIIPQAATDGVIRAIVGLGVVETVSEAREIVKFNRINKELVAAAVADTQSDLLAVTQNIERRVKATVRQVTAEAMRANLTKGSNATAAMSREIRNNLYKTIGNSADTAIIDASGRRWGLKNYVDMLVNTKMMQAHKEATVNEAVGRGALYGIISRHGATDKCRLWEGRIVKLTPEASGDYLYYLNLPTREIFHPKCRHVITPVRRPDRLPAESL